MSGLEGPAARAIGQAVQKLHGKARTRRANERVRLDAKTLVPIRVAEDLLEELNETETIRLNDYLASPAFEEIALQFVLGRMLNDVPWDNLVVDIREELRRGLRDSAGLRTDVLVATTDVVFAALATAFDENIDMQLGLLPNPGMVAVAAHITAAAAINSRLLREVRNLADIDTFARQLRRQVVAVHGHMRLPHLGISRSVPYDQLYVEPVVRPEYEQCAGPDLTALVSPGNRSVILGDPGAGKSTLAAKLAHDVASDLVPGAEGRVPFLLVLRNFAGSFRKGGRTLAHYLEQICHDPYNLEPPPKAVEYLLHDGRAVVLLDGLDELVEPELRRKFVDLVHGFVFRYPRVPLLVTARRIGYSDAPLDRELFSVGVVAELDEEQVRCYAERWFALDESTVESERQRVANSFLAESKDIAELRANPLLLALLCTMYASDHYIPRNLAQVYERCAVMLFERWDSMRGIAPMPLQFQGRLRGAVQYLAWQLFTAEESGKARPRHKIVRMLADFLVAKSFDEDDAIMIAEQFVEFCTGRAWILTDVGATDVEPRYGFTHRTFMEFFAAEHLVRTHPTPGQLWHALRPRVLTGEWEVVAQIALQLLDRNVDGGVDELLRLVLAEIPTGLDQQPRLRGFAARTLGYVHPGQDVIFDVVTSALAPSLQGDVRDRFHYWVGQESFDTVDALDGPLYTLMYHCSPGNLPAVRRILLAILGRKIESGNDTAAFTAVNLTRHFVGSDERTVRFWRDAHQDLRDRHVAALTVWSERTPWEGILTGVEPDRLVARFGAWTLFLADAFLVGSVASLAERLLLSGMSPSCTSVDVTKLCDALVVAARPWIPDDRWWTEIRTFVIHGGIRNKLLTLPWHEGSLAPMVLLYLPYIEATASDDDFYVLLPDRVVLLRELAIARAQGHAQTELVQSLQDAAFAENLRTFLISWARREFDLLARPQQG